MLVCPVIGFPHGNSTTEVKVFEAKRAVYEGGREIDMVVNIGRVKSRKWEFVQNEIQRVNQVVTEGGAVLKVIFENDCEIIILLQSFRKSSVPPAEKTNISRIDLDDEEIIKLCQICSHIGIAYVKTSTGYGFVKQSNEDYNYKGATTPQLELMSKHITGDVRIKAAGGIRTLDDLLRVRALGVSRVGATATEDILDEAIERGIGKDRIEVLIPKS